MCMHVLSAVDGEGEVDVYNSVAICGGWPTEMARVMPEISG